MTKQELFALRSGETIYHVSAKNADGTPLRARASGQPQEWVKAEPQGWRRPFKYGLRQSFYIGEPPHRCGSTNLQFSNPDNWTK